MQLEPWQISLISAAVGAVIPLLFVPIREYWADSKFRQNIKSVIISELKFSQNTLNVILEKGRREEDYLYVDPEILQSELPFDTTFYDDIDVESLGKTFKLDELMRIQKTYRNIIKFNRKYLWVSIGFRFDPELVESLYNEIGEIINSLDDCNR